MLQIPPRLFDRTRPQASLLAHRWALRNPGVFTPPVFLPGGAEHPWVQPGWLLLGARSASAQARTPDCCFAFRRLLRLPEAGAVPLEKKRAQGRVWETSEFQKPKREYRWLQEPLTQLEVPNLVKTRDKAKPSKAKPTYCPVSLRQLPRSRVLEILLAVLNSLLKKAWG